MSSISRTTQQPPPQPPHPHPPPPPPPHRYELEATIHSGKHLKNVNWKNGDLKAYAILWVDPDNKLTTKSDESGNTKPVWNQPFTLPLLSLNDAVFSLEIFHSKSSESPKPFVGSLVVPLNCLPEPDNGTKLRSFPLLRPSGRPQGKIKLKLAIRLINSPHPPLQDYQTAPHTSFYYSSAPPYPYANSSRSASPAPPPSGYAYSVGYYPTYYPVAGGSVGRGFPERSVGYGAPSAPVDYSPYEMRSRVGVGMAVGAVAGVLGGMGLDEEKVAERVEENYVGSSKDDFSEYRADF